MSSVISGSDNFNTDIIPAGRVASAWCNFNGTGVVAIRDSYNVSSITDNGTGDYTVNFAVALANANYSVSIGAASTTSVSAGFYGGIQGTSNMLTSSVRLQFRNNGGSIADQDTATVQIFGGQ
tara:strand:+ start:205 stop:573 length:369 start_codon:yes stop_codon:yes gene_type:complete